MDINGEDWLREDDFKWWSHHQVVECCGCETMSFRMAKGNSEDFSISAQRIESTESVTLYPVRTKGREPLKHAHLLPMKVQRVYAESLRALNNEQPVLAGMGIRALVETICKDKAASGGNLEQRIDALVMLGVLTPHGRDILHKIRTLGNRAAHEVKPHRPEQLELAIDVCEHILQGVYVYPHQAQATLE